MTKTKCHAVRQGQRAGNVVVVRETRDWAGRIPEWARDGLISHWIQRIFIIGIVLNRTTRPGGAFAIRDTESSTPHICYNDVAMTALTREDLRAYLEHWKRVGPQLEAIRREELRRFDFEAHRDHVAGLFENGCGPWNAPDDERLD
jgi:hypothetical protein